MSMITKNAFSNISNKPFPSIPSFSLRPKVSRVRFTSAPKSFEFTGHLSVEQSHRLEETPFSINLEVTKTGSNPILNCLPATHLMAHNNPDPIQDLIAEGKIRQVPYNVVSDAVVLVVSLDKLAENLITKLTVTYGQWEPLRTRYSGTGTQVNEAIEADVTNMVNFALWVTYNRLRAVAERYSRNTRAQTMEHRAPCSDRMEFPTFLSSTLQGIGPLRIVDAPSDVMVIYAPPAGTAANYGRGGRHQPNEGEYSRLLSLLRALNVQCSPIDLTPTQGSFATTCKFTVPDDGLVSIVGSVHGSHYTNDDINKFLLLADKDNTPFDDVSLTFEYINDPNTLTALAAVANPPNIPGHQAATPAERQAAAEATRPCGFIFPVNYLGICPAGDSQERGCYIIGRGVKPIFTVYLAQRLTAYDINSILRYHLTRTG